MMKEVSCHLLSNRPFVCSLHQRTNNFMVGDLIPGPQEFKLQTATKIYLEVIEAMFLR